MPGPVFPGKNMPQKRKEKSLFSVAPQGISGIFRKKARLAPFFGKKPAEENAPPAFPRLMRAPEKNGARCGTPLPGAGAARHARKSPGQARPQAAPRKKLLPPRMPCRRETMRHAAFPKAIPTGAAEKRRSRMLPVSCRGIRPALCASAFPPARPPGDCGQPPCFSRPGRSGAFPKMPHGAAAQLLPPKKQAFARPSAARFPGRAALFRERCCVESPPRKSGLSALLSGRGTPFPPLDGAECRETQKKRYFQLTLVFNFTNTALSLPREPRGAHARLPAGLPRHCRHQGKERLPESLP